MATGFDFADVFDEVVDRAGGELSTAADVVRVRRGLRLLLERWEAQGFNTWRIRTVRLFVPGVSPRVALPDDVDDIININVVRRFGPECDDRHWHHTGSEAPISRISAAQYAQLGSKLNEGYPSQYWLDRQDPPALMLHPVGRCELVITYVERPAAFQRYGNSLDDVPGRWLEAMIMGLAHDLARKRPPYNEGLIARLKTEAALAEQLAQDADRDRSRFRYQIGHRRR